MLCTAGLGAGCATGAAPEAPAPRLGLPGVVDSITRTPPLHRTGWGVEVTDLEGRVILSHQADQLFIPASNTKIITIVAALDLLGPDYRWETAVEALGVRDGIADALIVRGSGDPTLSEQFHARPFAPLDSLADSLFMAGLRRVEGPLVIDQGRFDSLLTHPAWESFDLDWYYGAPVAPFAVSAGAYPLVMVPGPPGGEAWVELLTPPGLVTTDARVVTVEGDRGWNDDLLRVAGTDSVVLRGEIGVEAGADTSWLAQDDPGRFAGRALVLALERRGVEVAGPVVVTRDPTMLALPAGADIRTRWRSAPLSAVAKVSLERSDNWVTEQVLKTLGAELGEGGSWSDGTAVVESYLAERVGIEPGAVYMRDGSGLTAQNLVTPRAMTTILRHAAQQPWSGVFRDALAAPGELESTMERRLVDHAERLAVKTGSIRHVNALSGYAITRSGETLAFSILTHASGRPASEVRAAADRIVEAILEIGSN